MQYRLHNSPTTAVHCAAAAALQLWDYSHANRDDSVYWSNACEPNLTVACNSWLICHNALHVIHQG